MCVQRAVDQQGAVALVHFKYQAVVQKQEPRVQAAVAQRAAAAVVDHEMRARDS